LSLRVSRPPRAFAPAPQWLAPPRAGFAPAYCSQRQERRVHAAAVLAVFGSGVAAFMLPDALKPDIQCVRTHWIRGFITFQLARRPEDRFARVG